MLKLSPSNLSLVKRTAYTATKSFNETSAVPSTPTSSTGRMKAWVIYYYGSNQQFTLSDSVPMPIIQSPTDVLIKVLASSVNPIDIRRREGYGGNLINTYQSMKNLLQIGNNQSNRSDFPLILGRDFCGEVVRKGPKVTKFNVGDKVFGALNVTRQGSFAEYCAANEDEICLKPKNFTNQQAAAMPLVALTSWYALRKFGGYNDENSMNKRALLIGASGGVGQVAIQLCSNLSIDITALCSSDSFDSIRRLGVQDTVDYREPDWLSQLSQKPKYDIIFDMVGPEHYSLELMNPLLNRGGTFVTIVTPVLRNTDKHGLLAGLTRTAYQAAQQTAYGLSHSINYRWAAYFADGYTLGEIKKLIENNKLRIRLDTRKFSFEQIPDAISYVESGQANGKVVIEHSFS